MARSKSKCIGKNLDGTFCKNWALKGNYYCQLHQGQATEQDRQEMKETENMSSLILVIIVILVFAMSSCLGCEGEFIKWLGQ